MNKLYVAVVIGLLPSLLFAQSQKEVDSLITVAEMRLNQSPMQSIELATKSRQLAEGIGYKKGIGASLALLGVANQKVDRYDTARTLLSTAAVLDAENGDSTGLAYCKYWLGNIELNNGKYGNALDLYQLTYNIARRTGDKKNEVRGLDGEAGIYDALNKDDEALNLYKQAYDLAVQSDFKAWIPGLILSLGDLDYKKNHTDSAIAKYKESIALSDSTGNLNNKANCYQRLSSIYFDKKDRREAMQYIEQAMDIFKQTGSVLSFSYGRLQMCNILLADNETDMAISLATQSFDEGKETGEKELEQNAAEVLYRAYMSQGDKARALEYHIKFHNLSEATHSDELSKKLAQLDLEGKFQAEQAKRDAELKAQIEKQRLVKSVSIVGILLLAIIAALSAFAFYQKRKDNELIAKEKSRSDALLLNILPKEVVEEIKQSANTETSKATVLFADLRSIRRDENTTSSPAASADYYFKKFDEIAAKNKIERIKTGGDAYLCLAATPGLEKDNALSVIRAAFDMQMIMQRAKSENKEAFFTLGIGIHSGPLVAGIVGIRKFSSDIWGDTVNVATRIELHGGDGKVNLSAATYELIKDKFNCVKQGSIETSQKESLEIYFAERT